MINPHDPHSGQQIRFHRTDPSGRWSPISYDNGRCVWASIGRLAVALLFIAVVLWLVASSARFAVVAWGLA